MRMFLKIGGGLAEASTHAPTAQQMRLRGPAPLSIAPEPSNHASYSHIDMLHRVLGVHMLSTRRYQVAYRSCTFPHPSINLLVMPSGPGLRYVAITPVYDGRLLVVVQCAGLARHS